MLKEITATGFKGASQGGLAAGFCMDIKTGGYAPNGYKLPGGDRPDLEFLGLVEHESDKLSEVVEYNLLRCDAVLFFCTDKKTKLEENILEMIDNLGLPLLEINITKPLDKRIVTNFIMNNKIDILHITGKSDRHDNKSVYKFVREYMTSIIKELQIEYSFGHGIY